MKKKGKNVWVLLVFLVAVLFRIPASAQTQNIYDEASLLDSQEKQALSELAVKLEEEYRMNFVVMTVQETGGMTEQDYADRFYEQHGYLDNGKKGGAIFYIDMDNRAVGIETEGDMILFMTDSRIEGAIDAAFDFVKEGAYADGLTVLMEETAGYMEEGIQSGQFTYNEDTGEYRKYRSISLWEAGVALLIALAAGGGACLTVAARYRMKSEGRNYNFRENGKLELKVSEDHFINQHVTVRHIPKQGDGENGGGPASTTHTSPGGNEFGGGSRKF